MCYFISVALPPKSQKRCLEQLPATLQIQPFRYQELNEKVKGFPIVVITQGMCSCDLLSRGGSPNFFKKYSQKGWSKSKIERAIENRQKADVHFNIHVGFRNWLADAAQESGEAFLFIHWDAERLDLETKVVLSPEEFRKSETYIKDEQLFQIKANYDARF